MGNDKQTNLAHRFAQVEDELFVFNNTIAEAVTSMLLIYVLERVENLWDTDLKFVYPEFKSKANYLAYKMMIQCDIRPDAVGETRFTVLKIAEALRDNDKVMNHLIDDSFTEFSLWLNVEFSNL